MRKSGRTTREQIRQMVDLIAKQFQPEKVILFGSQARGGTDADSDVDLLVVMRVEGSKRNKQLEIRKAVYDFRLPKDIIVTTPEEFEWRKEIVGTIERPAFLEGEVLYAKE